MFDALRAESFELGWREYAAGRPAYPTSLFSAVVRAAALRPDAPVLEVGAGTGNFTIGLLTQGLRVTAVDPGTNLLRVLSSRTDAGRCRTVIGRFEECDLPPYAFDAVFACHSWHWLDPAIRVRRCADLLHPDGRLIIVYNVHLRDGDPRFRQARAALYAQWAPEIEHLDPPSSKVEQVAWELRAYRPQEVRVAWERSFTADEFTALLRSYSNHMVLPDDRRVGLLAGVHRVIDGLFGGTVTQAFESIALIVRLA